MESTLLFWIFAGVICMATSSNALLSPQLGLFNLLGSSGNSPQRGRPMQPRYPNQFNNYDPRNGNNHGENLNLISLFPQNNNAGNGNLQLDPETRNTLTEQKEKLEDVLEKLKELNRQKDEENQKKMSDSPTTEISIYNGNNFNRPKPIPVENITKKPAYDISPSTGHPVPKSDLWKKLITKKFLFQVEPVMPEGETPRDKLTKNVYYLQFY